MREKELVHQETILFPLFHPDTDYSRGPGEHEVLVAGCRRRFEAASFDFIATGKGL